MIGVIRVRLVSSLFLPDDDVHEDPSMIKLEIIKKGYKNHFDKQFALKLKVRIYLLEGIFSIFFGLE